MNARTLSFALLIALVPACASSAPDDVLQPDDGTTDTGSAELSLCKQAACGPALGMPAIVCADGSIGGNTGRCLRDHGACGWEIRECPPTVPKLPPPTRDCSAPNACGPRLGMPNYFCKDGTTLAGPGACVDKGGVCGWEIIACP